MPLTASKTDADTIAATRVVTIEFEPPAITVLFMTPIHSSMGSGVAAATGLGDTAMLLSSNKQNAAILKSFFM